MIFAEVDTTPIWTTGGVVTLLLTIGGGARWLLGWFKEFATSQQAHEKVLSAAWVLHEEKMAEKATIKEKEVVEKFVKQEKESLAEVTRACDQFDATVKSLHDAQAKESSQTISVLLAMQKNMLEAVLALRQQSEKVEGLIGELRRQVDINGTEIKQFLRLMPEPDVKRVRKIQ